MVPKCSQDGPKMVPRKLKLFFRPMGSQDPQNAYFGILLSNFLAIFIVAAVWVLVQAQAWAWKPSVCANVVAIKPVQFEPLPTTRSSAFDTPLQPSGWLDKLGLKKNKYNYYKKVETKRTTQANHRQHVSAVVKRDVLERIDELKALRVSGNKYDLAAKDFKNVAAGSISRWMKEPLRSKIYAEAGRKEGAEIMSLKIRKTFGLSGVRRNPFLCHCLV